MIYSIAFVPLLMICCVYVCDLFLGSLLSSLNLFISYFVGTVLSLSQWCLVSLRVGQVSAPSSSPSVLMGLLWVLWFST